ncbi:MAG: ATP-binding protein [Gemmatimonadaceae bacterium]
MNQLAKDRTRGGFLRFLEAGGELGALTRAHDWSCTPLGPIESWSHSLRTTVSTMLASRHPMFLWWGPDLIQLYNDGYRPSLGDRHPEALGARGREFWAEIWPAIGPQIDAVLERSESTWHEDQLVPITRNGRVEDVYWTYSYSPVCDDDGNVGGVLVTVQETTSRVQLLRAERVARARAESAEARLANVFRQAPAFIAVVRMPGYVFELANDAYYELVGRRDLLGKEVLESLPELRGQDFIELLDEVIRTGTPFVGHDMPVMLRRTADKPPEQRFVTFVYQPLSETDGTRSAVFVHGVDVTDQVHAREAVEHARHDAERARAEAERARGEADIARAEAESANSAQSQFLTNMSHELRTPLNAIQGHVQLIDMELYGPVTVEQREALARVTRAEQHLLGLINDVLNFARLGSGKIEYDLTAVRLHEVVADMSPMIEPQLAARGVSYEVLLPEEPIAVWADRDKLVQVLLNLLSNAAKFTPTRGRVTVEVRTRAVGEQPEGVVFLCVADTGIGIPVEKLDSVFEPFVQIKSDYTATQQGTGLGLAISRDLARGMGGDLRARSTPGVSTTFTVSLRRAGDLE